MQARSNKKEEKKAALFTETYRGKLFASYEEIIHSPEIDAIYIPLPPALHFRWAKSALEAGKHVLLEKPATLNLSETKELIKIASERVLALHENYMFSFHNQIAAVNDIIACGQLGDIRLYRISFGFPRREKNDFRYNKELGGGALYDAGGYTLKYASMLLGSDARLAYAKLNYIDEFSVDVYGCATMINDVGTVAQIAFGMDNSYRCDLDVWGSIGSLFTGRILTAPDGFTAEAVIKNSSGERKILLPADDAFAKSISWFKTCIDNRAKREESYKAIERQAGLVEKFVELSSR